MARVTDHGQPGSYRFVQTCLCLRISRQLPK